MWFKIKFPTILLHYYPYGGNMGDICIGQDLQRYKYSGKELDRTFGLDLYDFEARPYDPQMIAIETNNGYILSPVEGLNHEANHAINVSSNLHYVFV